MSFYQFIRYMNSFETGFLHISIDVDDENEIIWEGYEAEFDEKINKIRDIYHAMFEFSTYINIIIYIYKYLKKKIETYFKTN